MSGAEVNNGCTWCGSHCQCGAGITYEPPTPSPAAAGLPLEDVERVARVLWEASGAAAKRWTWPNVGSILRDHYRTLAAAALAEMRPTAAVPDPRFRDQLAEVRADLIGDLPGAYPWHEIVDPWLAPDGPIDRLINAQVRARVQAAANNDVAVEDVRAIAVALGLGGHARPYSAHELVQREILPRAAALASPAPVPPDANGGEER